MIKNLMKLAFPGVIFLTSFLFPASESSHWKISSHIEQWEKFLTRMQERNRWDAFSKYYYSPNKRILDAFLIKTGIAQPGSFLKKEVAGLDVNQASTDLAAIAERNFPALTEETLRKCQDKLPRSKGAPVRIHLWVLFSMFDGMGLMVNGVPSVMLDCGSLHKLDSRRIKILIAHELNHAVRWSHVGDLIPPGGSLFDTKVKDSLVAEGLAVAFSEHVFPGEDLEQYIPFYFYHPERLEKIVENEREILEILITNREKTISHPSVSDYFYGNDPEDTSSPLRNSAYYIGYKIIRSLMQDGYGLKELTIMPAGKIIEKYIITRNTLNSSGCGIHGVS